MSLQSTILVLLYLHVLLYGCTAVVLPAAVTDCAKEFMKLDVLKKRAEKINLKIGGPSENVLQTDEFRINLDWRFTCNGSITSLLLGADIPNHRDANTGFPNVQVWRNTGGNTYTRIASQEIRLNPGNYSPDGVLQYNLNPSIPFQSGDVLGVYQPDIDNSNLRLYYFNNASAPVSYSTNNNPTTTISLTSLSTIRGQIVLITPLTTPSLCSKAFLSPMELRQLILEENINHVRVKTRDQRIYPDIAFTCNGSITKWIFGGEAVIDRELQPELQIWRRISSDTYNKINFTFPFPNETNHSNVHVNILYPPLKFQEGDILGVFQPGNEKLSVYYQDDTGPVNYRHDESRSGSASIFTISNPSSQFYYPLVSVEIQPDTTSSEVHASTTNKELRSGVTIFDVFGLIVVTSTANKIISTTTSESYMTTVVTMTTIQHGLLGTMDITTDSQTTIIIIIAGASSFVVVLLMVVVLLAMMTSLVLKKRNQSKNLNHSKNLDTTTVPCTSCGRPAMDLQEMCHSTSCNNIIIDDGNYESLSALNTPIDVEQNACYGSTCLKDKTIESQLYIGKERTTVSQDMKTIGKIYDSDYI